MPSFIQQTNNQEALAAIDLGSNALRAIIVRKNKDQVEVVKNIREPLRLGEDVFSRGRISPEKAQLTEEAFIRLFHTFMEYNVTDVRAMATSAMRDAQNSQALSDQILKSTGIQIQTIHGDTEAQLICDAVKGQIPLKKKIALLMDIGGGSTELTIVKDEKVIACHSFNVGTIRLLKYKNQDELEVRIRLQTQKMLRFIKTHLRNKKIDLFVGTGGNLRRIGKIRKNFLNKSTSEMANYSEIRHMTETLFNMSFVDRIRRLELDQNRADVILPAIMLTEILMKTLKMGKIHLPKVGLKEGILLSMLPTPPKKFILKE